MILSVFQLAKDLISPKDDLARELKEDKKRIKAKLDETSRLEEEETRRSLEVADDGTLPMPEEEEPVTGAPEEGEPGEEPVSPKSEGDEESPIKKLRRKKEKVEESK